MCEVWERSGKVEYGLGRDWVRTGRGLSEEYGGTVGELLESCGMSVRDL